MKFKYFCPKVCAFKMTVVAQACYPALNMEMLFNSNAWDVIELPKYYSSL